MHFTTVYGSDSVNAGTPNAEWVAPLTDRTGPPTPTNRLGIPSLHEIDALKFRLCQRRKRRCGTIELFACVNGNPQVETCLITQTLGSLSGDAGVCEKVPCARCFSPRRHGQLPPVPLADFPLGMRMDCHAQRHHKQRGAAASCGHPSCCAVELLGIDVARPLQAAVN